MIIVTDRALELNKRWVSKILYDENGTAHFDVPVFVLRDSNYHEFIAQYPYKYNPKQGDRFYKVSVD